MTIEKPPVETLSEADAAEEMVIQVWSMTPFGFFTAGADL
jgi:hypothetical protein